MSKKLGGFGDFRIDHLTAGKEVLDVGCGSLQLFYEPEKTRRRVGIDPSPAMVDAAKKLYPVSYHSVASAQALPFQNRSFDVVLLIFVLHHIPSADWPLVLREARRVSRGTVVILDHIQHDSWLPSVVQRLWWRIADGGEVYRKEREWKVILGDFAVNEYRRLGTLFRNICYFHLVPYQ